MERDDRFQMGRRRDNRSPARGSILYDHIAVTLFRKPSLRLENDLSDIRLASTETPPILQFQLLGSADAYTPESSHAVS